MLLLNRTASPLRAHVLSYRLSCALKHHTSSAKPFTRRQVRGQRCITAASTVEEQPETEAAGGVAEGKVDGRHIKSEEHRAKLKAAWERRRLQPVSEETRERMRRAKTGRQHSVATRRRIAQSMLGRKMDPETRAKISRAQLARCMARSALQQASQDAAAKKRRARGGIGALQTEWEDEGLSREAAVFELITLRREVGHLVAELGRAGKLPETAEEAGLPEALHRKLWRYAWLRDQVRGSSGAGPG